MEIPIDAPDVDAAAAMLRSTGPVPGAGLRTRVRPDGRVRARVVGGGSGPPVLVGRLAGGPHGVVLSGTVREARTERLTTAGFAGLTGLMALITGVLLLAGELANPGIYVCAAGAAAFAVITLRLRRARRLAFPVEADELEEELRAVAGS
ncbi:hypothetical protein GCM10009557_69610 [Virgisporangium ochraceum]